jgi:hypothetical protein
MPYFTHFHQKLYGGTSAAGFNFRAIIFDKHTVTTFAVISYIFIAATLKPRRAFLLEIKHGFLYNRNRRKGQNILRSFFGEIPDKNVYFTLKGVGALYKGRFHEVQANIQGRIFVLAYGDDYAAGIRSQAGYCCLAKKSKREGLHI